ncbi:MAG: response regulator [Gammaproteobacteria bacterium]|nr:response regulator [Gammaproteobacteria bacterium]
MITVLSIDDDKMTRKFVGKALDEEFSVIFANNGDDGIAKALSKSPDIILLDIEMPGKNGYEVCDYLKQQDKTCDIPVIFVSGRGDLLERMQGYEVGGADYVVKPFQKEDLIAKIRVLVQLRAHQESLEQKYIVAEKTAMEAMNSTSELGQVMAFVERSFDYRDHIDIAKAVFQVMESMHLNSVLEMGTLNGRVVYSSSGTVSPLESELIGMLRDGPRIKDFGCRTQINYPNISLLVKNMPLNDPNRYGRLKDVMPAMLSAADAKIRGLNSEKALQTQSLELNQAIEMIRGNLNSLSTTLDDNHKKSHSTMHKMFLKLSQELPRMGLEEDQEELILNSIDSAINEAVEISSDNEKVAQTYNQVLNELQQLVSRQNALLQAYVEPEADKKNEFENTFQAIELF